MSGGRGGEAAGGGGAEWGMGVKGEERSDDFWDVTQYRSAGCTRATSRMND